MTQARLKFASFDEYLAWSNAPENSMEGLFEWVDGALVAVSPESGLNRTIANRLFFLLVATGTVPLELVHPGQCEIQVPVLQPEDPANRYPDLVILEEAHLALTRNRLTITLEMPPPKLVVEVLSPGKQNRARDLVYKRNQYAARDISEYWLVDPEQQTVTVLQLQNNVYAEIATMCGNEPILSLAFPELRFTVEQVFATGQP